MTLAERSRLLEHMFGFSFQKVEYLKVLSNISNIVIRILAIIATLAVEQELKLFTEC